MLKADLKSLLELYGEIFVNDLIGRMNEQNVNATGNAARKIRYKANQTNLKITGPEYVLAVDEGLRRDNYKKRQPSTSKNGLNDWVAARVAPNLSGMELKRLTFAIAHTIKNNGTIKRFQYRGADLISFILNKNLNRMTADIADYVLDGIDKSITVNIKTNKNITVK